MATRLSHADQSALLQVLRHLYAQNDLPSLREQIARGASSLVPADWGSFAEFTRDGSKVGQLITFPDMSATCQPHLPAFIAYAHQHPLSRPLITGSIFPQKISDFTTLAQLQRTELYNEYYRWVSLRRQFLFSAGDDALMQRCVALNRSTMDFNERDRRMLQLLQPHCRQAFSSVARLDRLKNSLQAVNTTRDRCGEAMLIVDPNGEVGWLSAQARVGLREALGVDLGEGSALPDAVAAWLRTIRANLQRDVLLEKSLPTLTLKGRDRSWVMRCAVHDAIGNATLLLCPQSTEPDAMRVNFPILTRRENEVLSWIAQGKSNPEIALILGLSVRTVYKHVENLFAKLGVENRASAMLRVFEVHKN